MEHTRYEPEHGTEEREYGAHDQGITGVMLAELPTSRREARRQDGTQRDTYEQRYDDARNATSIGSVSSCEW